MKSIGLKINAVMRQIYDFKSFVHFIEFFLGVDKISLFFRVQYGISGNETPDKPLMAHFPEKVIEIYACRNLQSKHVVIVDNIDQLFKIRNVFEFTDELVGELGPRI